MGKISKMDSEYVERNSEKFRKFVDEFINRLGYEYTLSDKEVMELLSKVEEKLASKEVLIPITAYDNKELSALETTCKYLREELGLSYHEIGVMLNRNDRTIWTTYNNAEKKREKDLKVRVTKVFVPASIFKDRKLSVLESLVSYLKDKLNLRYSEIAKLLRRDERNIWTVYNRAKKKNR